MTTEPTIPCETCGVPTPMTGTKRCTNCWEVEQRLPEYLRSINGRKFVRKIYSRRRVAPGVRDNIDDPAPESPQR
jgi:hypothetical protein